MSRPMYFPPAPFELAEAVRCTRLVEAAYAMYAQWKAAGKPPRDRFQWQPGTRFELSYSPPIWGEDKELWLLEESEPFAFVAWSRNAELYLVIRGTESVEDWAVDADYPMTDYGLVSGYGRVHKGFYSVYASMSAAVRKAVSDACAQLGGTPEALFITGHSLGSSLATLSVPDVLAHTPVHPDEMRIKQYNLASPRTGDTGFAAAYNANGVVTYRMVNSTDLVPEVPPSIIGADIFEHIGIPVTFSAQYNSLAGNHSCTNSYRYALTHPEQPQGPTRA
jgi:triacylglycerol lipase